MDNKAFTVRRGPQGYRCTNPADITVDKDGKCSGHTTKLEDSEHD